MGEKFGRVKIKTAKHQRDQIPRFSPDLLSKIINSVHYPHQANSKWIKDLNEKYETIKKKLEKNTESNLFDISHGNFLLDMSSEARETKAKINDCDFIKIKSSAPQGKQLTKLKHNLLNGRR